MTPTAAAATKPATTATKPKAVAALAPTDTQVHASATLAEALAAFQSELPRVEKAQKVDAGKAGKYDYADLTAVSEAALPRMASFGLSVNSTTKFDKTGRFVLVMTLRHTSGEKAKSFYPLPDPLRVNAKDMGSYITYARRYLLNAITGVAPGGSDDDSNPALSTPPQQQQQRPAAARVPIREEAGPLPEGLYDLASIASVEDSRRVWKQASAAGHLNLIVNDEQGNAIPFGQFLQRTADRLIIAPEESGD